MKRGAAGASLGGIEGHSSPRGVAPLWLSLSALVLASVLFVPVVEAEEREAHEYSIKAAYLYNFMHFITWPAESHRSEESRMELCVLGQDPFHGKLLNATKGRTVRGRALHIRRNPTADADTPCHVLLVSRSEQGHAVEVVDSWRRPGVLIVSDAPGFLEAGAVIELIQVDERIAFRINLHGANEARLKISSQLLELAQTVLGTPALTPEALSQTQ